MYRVGAKLNFRYSEGPGGRSTDGVVGHHVPAKYANITHIKRKILFLPKSNKHCRMPILPESALLVKLYYCNSENAAAVVRVPPSQETTMWTDVGDMMVKFTKTELQSVLPGRERQIV
ncbi:hypothetical protein TNCV_49531 [Trichonephila clavipes]|nr:hypothetical protein TNCV_49531 [Trichonephila clavipes]